MPSLGDVAMSNKMNKKIKVLVGNFNSKDGPCNVFDKSVILLLNEISNEIFLDNFFKKYEKQIKNTWRKTA